MGSFQSTHPKMRHASQAFFRAVPFQSTHPQRCDFRNIARGGGILVSIHAHRNGTTR